MMTRDDSAHANAGAPAGEVPICLAHDEVMSERRCYRTDGAQRVEHYCHPCENAALWRLARSAGK